MSPRLDHLWNGWRNEYVQTGGAAGGVVPGSPVSVFTRILESGLPDAESFIVHRGATCFVILNAFPYSTGHALVLPYRQAADLDALGADEATELWATVTLLVRAVRAAYRPEGVNVGINMGKPAGGSVSEHLHVHVVPRWVGDSNFMSVVADTRTIPEPLGRSWEKLRRAWPDAAAGP